MMRTGMWIRTSDEKTGIVTQVDGDQITVDLTNDKGETIETAIESATALRQARRTEIPAPRRPSKAAAASFGYE